MDYFVNFDYHLPEKLVAHKPASPRDSARLLLYHTQTDKIEFVSISDLPNVISNTHIVYNDTTVLPARLHGKLTGDRDIELLILVDQGITDQKVKALVNTRVRNGEVITVKNVNFTVLEDHEKSMLLSFNVSQTELLDLLNEAGQTPLPPYIHSTETESEKRQNYQSIFATAEHSVAAPTASLHFTQDLVEQLNQKGNTWSPVTLQVGLGTFAPIFPENFTARKLHQEHFYISKQSAQDIEKAKEKGKQILAIGTTVIRTLESGVKLIKDQTGGHSTTDLFIFPPHKFTYPDILLTNFHVPKSSLLCLVQAFLEHKGSRRRLIDIYKKAIEAEMRFFSYGDAMVII